MDLKRARGWVGAAFVYYPSPVRRASGWRYRRVPIGGGNVEERNLDLPATASKKAAKDAIHKLADDERAAAEAARIDPTKREPTDVGLRAALDQWLSRFADLEDSTLAEYRTKTQVWTRCWGDDRIVSTIGYPEVEAFFTTWYADRDPSTKLAALALMTRFFRWCVKSGYTRLNPALLLGEEVDIVGAWSKAKSRAPRAGRALSHEEAVKLLEATRTPYGVEMQRRAGTPEAGPKFSIKVKSPEYLFPLLVTAMKTGLRERNLVSIEKGLRWNDLDLTPGAEILHIDGTRMKNHCDLIVPLHPEVGGALRAWRKSLDVVSIKGLVFDARKKMDGKQSRVVVRRSLQAAAKRAGIGHLSIHDMRRTAETAFQKANPGAETERMIFAGHKAPSAGDRATAVDASYVRLTAEHLRPFINKMPWFFPATAPAAVAPTATAT